MSPDAWPIVGFAFQVIDCGVQPFGSVMEFIGAPVGLIQSILQACYLCSDLTYLAGSFTNSVNW